VCRRAPAPATSNTLADLEQLMSRVYLMQRDGLSASMERIHCTSEDEQLQRVLERNHDLLPGDQINPDDPCRWLLIKREMPVPDPATGLDRWSVDFFFADQNAIPTFVECKRFRDTRARREVVGQMLEYAANGHHYWDKELLREMAESSAKQRGTTLDSALEALAPATGAAIESYLDRIQENLREGQLRIIFFLENSSPELRSVVDFLNKQMERSEVLLVEARQYAAGGTHIVVPNLFGYTEQARLVKRTVSVSTAGSRRKWDHAMFFDDAAKKNDVAVVGALSAFLDNCLSAGYQATWGTGNMTGSFNVKIPSVNQRSLVSMFSNGRMQLNLGWLPAETASWIRDYAKKRVLLTVPDEVGEQYPSYAASEWIGKQAELLMMLADAKKSLKGTASTEA
jgi:hypothetical protein